MILIKQAYVPPFDTSINESDWFEDYIEDLLDEAEKIGPVQDIVVLDNLGPHLIGNTYIQFRSQADAERCVQLWENRSYRAHTFKPALCNISDFSNARCYQNDAGNCKHGPSCNFFHVRPLPKWLLMRIYDAENFFETLRTETANGWYSPELYAEHFKRRGLTPVPDQTANKRDKSNAVVDKPKAVGEEKDVSRDESTKNSSTDDVVRRGRGFELKS
jgi:hypothetical protein